MFMILLMNASSSIQCCQSVCSLFSVWAYTRFMEYTMLITYWIYNYITYRFNYVHADLSKTCNVYACIHGSMNWTSLIITLYCLIHFCVCILLACRLGRVSYSGGGGRGAPWDFHPQKANIMCFNTITKHSNTCMGLLYIHATYFLLYFPAYNISA